MAKEQRELNLRKLEVHINGIKLGEIKSVVPKDEKPIKQPWPNFVGKRGREK